MTDLEARTICVDIDGTLCHSSGAEGYAEAEPISGAREALRQLRQGGWIIVLHTARHFNNWLITTEWLSRHGFDYDQIVFGKPPARFYVDDRAVVFDGNWVPLVEQLGVDSTQAIGKTSHVPDKPLHR
jgi:uncharacterized HAD superfamily protein